MPSVVTGERKAPAVKNGKLRKKKGKKKKGADRWGQCAVKGRERTAAGARVVKAEREVLGWAMRGSRPVREGSSGPKRAGHRVGRAVQLRAGRRDRPPKQASVGKRKGKGVGLVRLGQNGRR